MDNSVFTAELAKEIREAFPCLILASASANRLALLKDCGILVTQAPQDINEICSERDGAKVVKTLSRKKLESYLEREGIPDKPLIAVDTLVSFEGSLMGKPADIKEAESFLRRLSGKSHLVYSGLSLFMSGETITFFDTSKVTFRPLTKEDIETYLDSMEWQGAAGGYRFQKTGYKLIAEINGSRSNVVGLPLEKLLSYSKALRSARDQA